MTWLIQAPSEVTEGDTIEITIKSSGYKADESKSIAIGVNQRAQRDINTQGWRSAGDPKALAWKLDVMMEDWRSIKTIFIPTLLTAGNDGSRSHAIYLYDPKTYGKSLSGQSIIIDILDIKFSPPEDIVAKGDSSMEFGEMSEVHLKFIESYYQYRVRNGYNYPTWNLETLDIDANDRHTYSFVDGDGADDNAEFTLNENQLRFSGKSVKKKYSVRVRSTDIGGLATEKIFTIYRDGLPNEAPAELQLSAYHFNESIIDGSVIATLSSTDPDRLDQFTYSFFEVDGNSDNDAFEIIDNQLMIKTSPDYETKDSYNIGIRTTDSGGLTFENSFTLTVDDLPEKNFDFNDDGNTTLEHDAIIGLRMMFGTFPGDALIDGAITPKSTKSITDIQALMSDTIYDGSFDLDSDGIISPFTDGLKLIEEIQQLQIASTSDQLLK